MPYAEDALPDPETPEIRTSVQHFEVTEDEAGQRLDNYVHKHLSGVPRTRVYRVIRKGEVRVNGKRAGPETRLNIGDKIRLPPVRVLPAADPGKPPLDLVSRIREAIVHEDERLLVIDKPAGIAVHGGSGLSFGVIEALRASRPKETLELAHRLDRDTSGCLLVTRRHSALRALHALLREGAVQKGYLALLAGRWTLGHKRIDAPLRTDARVSGERTVRVHAQGKNALTEFKLIEHYGARASLLEAIIHTGRTHQIRVHAAHCGHPVLGDQKYGTEASMAESQELGLTRMFLHAHSCSFVWPDGLEQSFSAPLPDALRSVLQRLPARSAARVQRQRQR
jgi:23S rRNA pseudouridine955/2504/2580 synthase